MLPEFKNESYTDFSVPENKDAMLKMIEKVNSEMGKKHDLLIAGERVELDDKISSINPSKTGEVVGLVSKADAEHGNRAIDAAAEAFEYWKRVPGDERARYLFKAAEVMRRRRLELGATMVVEVGKNWLEADADVAEAIDFLEFYGREMIRLSRPQPLTRTPTEENELYYIPLGVGLVIPPWNFPLAILVGMASASIVAGNSIVLKPASTSPVIGAKFVEIMEEVGLPKGVLNFCPGSGAVIGDGLVSHPKTRFVTFTGSKEVGLRIIELASKVNEGQIWIKRVVAEMGGKDTIIVDKEIEDVESAVAGVVASAYGYQGQKCSACSRLVLLEDIHDDFLEKVVAKTKEIKVGDVRNPDNYMGGVIDKNAYNSILEYIEIGKNEANLVTGGEKAPGDGYFIQPTIFSDVDPMARVSQEEIFGPVLSVLRAKDFDQALEIANNTEYGLTGAVYSSNRRNLEKARWEFHVGNLYFNRKCTGALVGVHPFGGFNMSGTDSKAGGRDYLLLLTQAKSVSEKI